MTLDCIRTRLGFDVFLSLQIQQIVEGKLFPMKALGYFAVVTGKGKMHSLFKSYSSDLISNFNQIRLHM